MTLGIFVSTRGKVTHLPPGRPLPRVTVRSHMTTNVKALCKTQSTEEPEDMATLVCVPDASGLPASFHLRESLETQVNRCVSFQANLMFKNQTG